MGIWKKLFGGESKSLTPADAPHVVKQHPGELFSDSEDNQAIDSAIKMLFSSDTAVASAAAKALGQLNHPRCVQPLVEIISNSRKFIIVSEAEKALAGLSNPETISQLIAVLNNCTDSEVHRSIDTALRKMGAAAVGPLISTLKNVQARERIVKILSGEKVGRLALSALISSLSDTDSDMRLAVVNILANIPGGGKVAKDALANTLNDPNSVVRWNALKGLVKLNDTRAIAPLISEIKKENTSAIELLGKMIGKVADETALLTIIDTLKHPNPQMKDTAIRQFLYCDLDHSAQVKAVEPLINVLNDSKRPLCGNAAEVLSRLKAQRALDPILDCWQNLVEDVKREEDYETAETFQKVIESFVGIGIARVPDNVLVKLLNSKDAPMNLEWENAVSFGCRLDFARKQARQELVRRGLAI